MRLKLTSLELTTKEDCKTLDPLGKNRIRLHSVTSENDICFNSSTNLFVEVEYNLDGKDYNERFYINSYAVNSKRALFIPRDIVFRSYFQIKVINDDKKLDYKLKINYFLN